MTKIAATLVVLETFGRYAKKLDETQQEFRERAFLHAVKDIPYPCIDAAFMDWSTTQAEYPTPAEIKELAEDHFRLLKRDIFRLRKLLEQAAKPQEQPKIEYAPIAPITELKQAGYYASAVGELTKQMTYKPQEQTV